jgi:hypothetical protein
MSHELALDGYTETGQRDAVARRSETPPKIIDRGMFTQSIKCYVLFIE